ncbi:MAG: sulfatase-like hydrolase/transferase, partial [Prolixibacteraceae bacterium]|nr:sulfatase-like hydrolase/transferase [Prolixibacteraceae bacterium]
MNHYLVKSIVLISASAGFFNCSPKKQEAERPNILFIMSDDHAYQAISAYGYGLNETPNIDRLANEGAIFTRANVTNSICAPSRAV